MSKRKANIRPDLIGEYFTDGENIYRLVGCETGPIASMIKLTGDEIGLEEPISAFANFVRLKPERPIVKLPAPRKLKWDAGKPRELENK